MRMGRSITDMATEIERQAATKKDYVVPTELITVMPDAKTVAIGEKGSFGITEMAHNQLGEFLKIPAKHYDRLRSAAPHLLSLEANHFLRETRAEKGSGKRMVRTLDGNARAFLSDRYRRLDNFDLMQAVLPKIMGDGTLQIASCEITEQKLYMKVISPKTETEIVKGDPVRAGFVVSNSEIGMGAISVAIFIDRLVCTNGMISTEFGQRRNHVGRATVSMDESFQLYSDATLQLDDAAFFAKISDTVDATLQESKVAMVFDKMRRAAAQKIDKAPEAVVEELGNRYGLNVDQTSGVLRNLIDGGMGLNRWALLNSVTQLANTTESYDEATRLENVGGLILEMAEPEWKALAAAA